MNRKHHLTLRMKAKELSFNTLTKAALKSGLPDPIDGCPKQIQALSTTKPARCLRILRAPPPHSCALQFNLYANRKGSRG